MCRSLSNWFYASTIVCDSSSALSGEECDHQHHEVFTSLEDTQQKSCTFERSCDDKECFDVVLDHAEMCHCSAEGIGDDDRQHIQPFHGSIVRREDVAVLVLVVVDYRGLAFYLQYTSQHPCDHGYVEHVTILQHVAGVE